MAMRAPIEGGLFPLDVVGRSGGTFSSGIVAFVALLPAAKADSLNRSLD